MSAGSPNRDSAVQASHDALTGLREIDVRCPGCGSQDQQGKFCSACGERLNSAIEPEVAPVLWSSLAAADGVDTGPAPVATGRIQALRGICAEHMQRFRQRPQRQQRLIAGVAASVALALTLGVATALGQDDDDYYQYVDVSAEEPVVPMTPQERCTSIVMLFLDQVPQALRDGYQGASRRTRWPSSSGTSRRSSSRRRRLRPRSS